MIHKLFNKMNIVIAWGPWALEAVPQRLTRIIAVPTGGRLADTFVMDFVWHVPGLLVIALRVVAHTLGVDWDYAILFILFQVIGVANAAAAPSVMIEEKLCFFVHIIISWNINCVIPIDVPELRVFDRDGMLCSLANFIIWLLSARWCYRPYERWF